MRSHETGAALRTRWTSTPRGATLRSMDPCAAVLRDLPAYLDGTLAPLRAAEVEGHLATCLSCMAEAQRRGDRAGG